MTAIWVTANWVNPPKNNPKFGSIKDNVLGYISVPAATLSQFQKGKRYLIEIEEKGDFKNFVRFANPSPQQPAQSTNGNFDGRRLGQAQPVARTVQRPVPQAPQGTFAQQFDAQALNIFVTGLTGRALGSGHFAASDIDELVCGAKAAFMKHLSGVPEAAPTPRQTSAPEPEFNDPLPNPDQYGQQSPVDDDWQQ